jgi:hypothetical protein
VRVFKTKDFARFARRESIADPALCAAIERAMRGLIDADLGGGVIKQRVPRKGQGRSGGYRTLIAFKTADRSVFMFGFAKSDMDNITREDLTRLKLLAADALAADDQSMGLLISSGEWKELDCNV